MIKDVDECIGVTCQNDGTCVDGLAEYTCACAAGYGGDHCEIGISLSLLKKEVYSFIMKIRKTNKNMESVSFVFGDSWLAFSHNASDHCEIGI